MRWMRWLGLAALMVAGLGVAQTPAEKVLTQGGVSFVAGGIGVASQERLKAIEKEFNLKLVFTLVEGNYLADIAVAVKDAKDKTVIEHMADGPFFLARLPAGTYAVTAARNGETQTRKVMVRAGRLLTEHMRWPSKPGIDFPLPRASGR